MDSPIQNFFLVTPFGIYCLYCSPGTCLISKNTQDLVDHFAKHHKRVLSVIDNSYDVLEHKKNLLKVMMTKNPFIAMDYVLHDAVCRIVCFECARIFQGMNSFGLHQKQSNVCKPDGHHVLKFFQTVCGHLLYVKQPNGDFFLFSNRTGKLKTEDKFLIDESHNKIRHLRSVRKTAIEKFKQVSDVF